MMDVLQNIGVRFAKTLSLHRKDNPGLMIGVISATLLCLLGLGSIVNAQSTYHINEVEANNMKLSGTSTFHDWTMNARTFSGEAQFEFTKGNDHQLTVLRSLTFCLETLNLKSDKKGLDKNAYKALKADHVKNIQYELVSSKVLPEKENRYLIKTRGNLSIAGITKEVAMDVHCTVNSNATVSCSGSDKLNMTDYAVTPPAFMLGAMKTGDAVILDFTVVYKRQEGI